MSHDEMKQKGNECIRQKRYNEAVEYYTLALESNPASHTVYSNRSLAFNKLGRFDAALNDANKCVEISPNFARGYLRKCVALIGLSSYEEAKAAAEIGYKLRASDTICQDCIMQWLEANQALLKGKIDKCLEEIGLGEDVIPRGYRIISDDYLTIFLNLLLCRLQFTTIGVEMKYVKSCILQLLQELDRILQLFGHTPHTCANEWLATLCLASKTDPSTSRVPPSIVAKLLEKSKEFSVWLDLEVDHALYPIIRPLMCLILIGVVACCISLNVLNSEQHVMQVSCQACLPFFEVSLLSTPEYMEQHVGIYKELLESYSTSNFVFTNEEIQFGKQCITKLEALLERCPTNKYTKEVIEKAMVSIALARIRLGQSPGFDPVSYAPGSGKAVSQVGKTEPEKLRAYVREKQELLKSALEVPPDTVGSTLMEFTYEDIQDLLCCIGKIYLFFLLPFRLCIMVKDLINEQSRWMMSIFDLFYVA